MIIINTKNGAVIVNENDITLLKHLKKETRVVIYAHGQPHFIEDVEMVRLTNKEERFVDEGSLVESLHKNLDYVTADRQKIVSLVKKLEKGCYSIAYDIESVGRQPPSEQLKALLNPIAAKAYELRDAEYSHPGDAEETPDDVQQ